MQQPRTFNLNLMGFDTIEINLFLTKVGEGGDHKTYCQKYKHPILYDLLLNLAHKGI